MHLSHQAYAQNEQSHHDRIREVLTEFTFSECDRILDIGCGDGRITAQISKSVPKGSVVGLDVDPSFIELARRNFSAQGFPNLTFSLADILSAPFENEFDVITSFASLHLVFDYSAFLNTVSKALRPQGEVLLLFINASHDETNFFTCLKEFLDLTKWRKICQTHNIKYFYSNLEEWEKLLLENRFEIQIIKNIDETIQFESLEEFHAFIKHHWISLMSKIPAELQDGFIDKLLEFYIFRSKQVQDDSYFYHVKWLHIVATKHRPLDS